MEPWTLVSDRRYYGLDPVALLQAAGRVLARVAGMPPGQARVSIRSLQQDFALDTVQGQLLAENFVEDGLLRRHAAHASDFELMPRFHEFASARVVEPMPRTKAKQLIALACKLAERINRQWTRNPFEIDALAVSGGYMSRTPLLAELTLGVVLRSRAASRGFVFWRRPTRSEGASEIQNGFRDLSSFVNAYIAIDTQGLVRPFSLVYKAEARD